MTSSTRRSDPGTRWRVAVLLCLAGAAVLAHTLLEGVSLAAERYLGAYLWKQQDHLRLFSPANHVDRGRRRLYLFGPSEAREDLLPEEIDRFVPGWRAYPGAQSVGTLEDALLVLEYLEGAYGPSAVPEALVLGITPRFVGDLRPHTSPLVDAINKYSPHFSLTRRPGANRLEPKSASAAFAARWALLRVAPDRYRRALVSIASAFAVAIAPSLETNQRRLQLTMPAKYLEGKYYASAVAMQKALTTSNVWARVHAWDVDVERARRELEEFIDFARRHEAQAFVVNLPEHPMNRAMFAPDRYDAYLNTVRAAIGTTPFLDLRTLLDEDDFFDEMHATWKGGIAVSRAVGTFVAASRRPIGDFVR